MGQSRRLDEPPVMAAQVALLQWGAEFLAAHPPMTFFLSLIHFLTKFECTFVSCTTQQRRDGQHSRSYG